MAIDHTDSGGDARRGVPPVGPAPGRPAPPSRYTLKLFLEDHRDVTEALGCGGDACGERALDGGRLLPLALHVTHWHDDDTQDAIDTVFIRRYGVDLGGELRDRFFQVMRFLAENHAIIERDGFGRFEPTTEVHEELVGYLLDEAAANPLRPIATSALHRFYDGWGERWF